MFLIKLKSKGRRIAVVVVGGGKRSSFVVINQKKKRGNFFRCLGQYFFYFSVIWAKGEKPKVKANLCNFPFGKVICNKKVSCTSFFFSEINLSILLFYFPCYGFCSYFICL